MSSPIMPAQGPTGPSTAPPPTSHLPGDTGAFVSELAASEASLALGASRGGPPAEVLDQVAAAAAIADRLRQDGHRLQFLEAGAGQPARLEIEDLQTNSVRTLSAAEAAELAAGNISV